MTDLKPRRKRRTKASIAASIDSAATAEIAQNGFVSSLVTNIIKSAQIEPQVFYNRYKDINEFYDAFVNRYDGAMQELVEQIEQPLVSKQGITALLQGILKMINDDPISLELLRWEICEKNKTTTRTSLLRELNLQPIVQGFMRCFKGSGIDAVGVFAILLSGVYYISLHKKQSPLHGIDLNTNDGKEQVNKVLEYLVSLVFDSRYNARRETEIAERLRSCGVREDVIAKALGYNEVATDGIMTNIQGDLRSDVTPS